MRFFNPAKYPDCANKIRNRTMNKLLAFRDAPVKPPDKCDYSRNLIPTKSAQVTKIKRKNYGVIVTVWDALCCYDTAGPALVISLDTEYQFNPSTSSNTILSYQVTAFGRGRRMAQLIFHVPDECAGLRLSLSEIVEEARHALGIKPGALKFKLRAPGALRVIAHFTTAEWAALRDRRQLAAVLQIIRKSPVTLGAQKNLVEAFESHGLLWGRNRRHDTHRSDRL